MVWEAPAERALPSFVPCLAVRAKPLRRLSVILPANHYMNNPDPKSYLLVWKLREKVTRKLGGKKRMQRRGVLESLKRRRKEKQ